MTFVDGNGDALGQAVTAPSATGTRWAEYALEFSPLSAGDLRVSAEYSGTPSQRPSASTEVVATISAWETTTEIALAQSSVVAHETVDVIATVESPIPGGAARRGEVQLLVDGVATGDPVAVVDGAARMTVPAYQMRGEREISARFNDTGGAFQTSSSNAEILRVDGIPSSITMTPVGTPYVGRANEFHVRVTGADGLPLEGLVSYLVDGIPQGQDTLVDGEATTTLPVATTQPMTVEVSYSPGPASFYLAETDDITIDPQAVPTTTVLDAFTATRPGAPIVLSATVDNEIDAAQFPIGTVRFVVSGAESAEVPASHDGGGVFSGTFTPSRPGEIHVVAQFTPANVAEFVASASSQRDAQVRGFLVELVEPASVTVGQSQGGRVRMIFRQEDSGAVAPEPVSGIATFTLGAQETQVPVQNGVAEFAIPAGLAVGTHSLRVAFVDPVAGSKVPRRYSLW